jgi:FAD/FMN-containing dehydrogenase
MMIEDVVCPVEHLAGMTADLITLFKECGYSDASAVGHALEGNLHLVFAQVGGLYRLLLLLLLCWVVFLQRGGLHP